LETSVTIFGWRFVFAISRQLRAGKDFAIRRSEFQHGDV
jgi:hypothetical protein